MANRINFQRHNRRHPGGGPRPDFYPDQQHHYEDNSRRHTRSRFPNDYHGPEDTPYGEQWQEHGHYRQSQRTGFSDENRFRDQHTSGYDNPSWQRQRPLDEDQGYPGYLDSYRRGADYSHNHYAEGNQYPSGQRYPGTGATDDREHNRNWWNRTRDEVYSWLGDDDAQRRRNQDIREEGEYKGRGPKGYRRSDERIRDDINDRLSDDSYVDASDVEVLVENGEVTLSGIVMDKKTKRRAEDIAESVSGVTNVENRMRISIFTRKDDDSDSGEMEDKTSEKLRSREKKQ